MSTLELPAVDAPPDDLPPGHRPIVLVIDDHGPSRAVARTAVAPLGAHVLEAASVEEAWASLVDPLPDVILLDLMMPDIDGMTFARILRADARLSEIPILMITAATGRAERLAALEAGVDDFITKPVDRLELRARVATVCRLGRFRKLVEERQRTASLVTMAPIGVLVIDAVSTAVHFANARAGELLPHLTVGSPLLARLDAAASAQLKPLLGESSPTADPVSMRWLLADGTRHCDVAAGRVNWDGAPALQLVFTDVTAMQRVEEQLHRKDRLDAVGRLAASVAHDFATIVQVCQLHLHRARLEPQTEVLQTMHADIGEALRRGGLMTQDLLRFCRRPDSIAAAGSCDATFVLRGIERLLERLSPPSIVTTVRAPDLPTPIALAAHELEQAIVNLVSNARDSIHNAGRIDVTLTHDAAGAMRLSVRDTGTGMPPEVVRRLGEPFFTTKAEGQGTGLGVWMVRRVLEQSGGTLEVQTRLGEGTEVTLVIPTRPAPTVEDDA